MGWVIMWLVIVLIAGLIDILTSNFFFVLFSIGAIASAICAGLGVSVLYQIIVFAIVSLIVMILVYPWIKKKYKMVHKRTPLMEETYIGKTFIADKDIDEKAQIKVGGEYWTAINEGEKIKKNDKFKIISIEGIKLKIRKIKEE